MGKNFTLMRLSLFSFLFLLSFTSFAQNPGSLDPTFFPMPGPSQQVNCMELLPNGKILIAGNFDGYGNLPHGYFVRVNSDSSIDDSFNAGTAANDYVYSMALQPDGKILIGGNFTSYNGVARSRLARINADGTLDTTFNPGTGANNVVYSISVLPNGKIIISGIFTNYNGVSQNRLARLHADGSLDTSFNIGTGAEAGVQRTVLLPDGKILIGGLFTSYNGVDCNYLVRLNSNGTIDPTFQAGTKINSGVLGVTLQPDGKILIGGFFSTYNSISRKLIARLNADGTLDTSFDPGIGGNNVVWCIAVQHDGKILVGGQFNMWNGTTSRHLVALNSNGSINTDYVLGTGLNHYLYSIIPQPNGKVLLGGGFNTLNGVSRDYLARLNGHCTTTAPTGQATQLVTAQNPTIGNLVVNGTGIRWYDSNGEPLAVNTTLFNGTTYYASQTLNNCESPLLAVTATVALGVDTQSDILFDYFPNPVTDKLQVSAKADLDSVEIYNLYGQKVAVYTINTSAAEIDMSQLASASYLIKANSGATSSNFIIVKK